MNIYLNKLSCKLTGYEANEHFRCNMFQSLTSLSIHRISSSSSSTALLLRVASCLLGWSDTDVAASS